MVALKAFRKELGGALSVADWVELKIDCALHVGAMDVGDVAWENLALVLWLYMCYVLGM